MDGGVDKRSFGRRRATRTRYRGPVRPLQQARGLGRPVDLRPGVLKALVGAHMVYFRDRGDHLSIIRILLQRQDVSRSL